jgi:hypothetical protein
MEHRRRLEAWYVPRGGGPVVPSWRLVQSATAGRLCLPDAGLTLADAVHADARGGCAAVHGPRHAAFEWGWRVPTERPVQPAAAAHRDPDVALPEVTA